MIQSKVKGLVTDSVNLSLRATACMRSISNADCTEDAEVLECMALSFSIDLTKKLRELEGVIYSNKGKSND